MKTRQSNNERIVKKVFQDVFDKYDLMNDLMSLGIHRLWKKNFIYWLNPQKNTTLIDVCSGTGDIAKLYLNKINYSGSVCCVDENKGMLNLNKKRFKKNTKVKWFCNSAEKLPFKNNHFDYYTISFGIRNVNNINNALKEAYRVLKPGGSLIAIETLGHNLLFNCKRKWNVLLGNRTTWTADHIMKKTEWRKLSAHFETIHIDYFGLTGLILVPLIRFLPHKIKIIFAKFFSTIDQQLFKVKMLKPLAFKTVVQLTGLRQS